MGFYTFQLAGITPENIRSRSIDKDLITFGVLVNGRDQGHGYTLIPVGASQTTLRPFDLTQGALVNGFPFHRDHMSEDWVIGPLWVADGDQVSVVYTATNTSDSDIPTAHQQEIDQWTIKLVDIYYSLLLGEFESGLGLEEVAEYIGKGLSLFAKKFIDDPVGTILGVEPQGPCNGTVFADSKAFTGASLAQLPSTPSQVDSWGVTINTAWAELTQHYTDEATHDNAVCGDTAQTDVTIRVTRYDHWTLKFGSDVSLAGGMRAQFPAGGNVKELYGLRI